MSNPNYISQQQHTEFWEDAATIYRNSCAEGTARYAYEILWQHPTRQWEAEFEEGVDEDFLAFYEQADQDVRDALITRLLDFRITIFDTDSGRVIHRRELEDFGG